MPNKKDMEQGEFTEDIVNGPCPYCGHERIRWDGSIQPDDDHTLMRYQQCKSCHKRWELVYIPDHRIIKN